MDNHICNCPETLAIATVPKQEWCDPYPWETALYEGTIFPCLNLLFYKAPLSTEADRTCSKPINNEERAREDLMKEIYAVSFAINDLTLYLDTHPDCEKGTPVYHELLQRRLHLLAEFAKKFYPLTHLSVATGSCEQKNGSLSEETADAGGQNRSECLKGYSWSEGPMPWEGGCI